MTDAEQLAEKIIDALDELRGRYRDDAEANCHDEFGIVHGHSAVAIGVAINVARRVVEEWKEDHGPDQ